MSPSSEQDDIRFVQKVQALIRRGYSDDEIARFYLDHRSAWDATFISHNEAGLRLLLGVVRGQMGVPEAPPTKMAEPPFPSGPEWTEVVRAYRRARVRRKRPSADDVSAEMGLTMESLADRLHALGIRDYRHIHALMAEQDQRDGTP